MNFWWDRKGGNEIDLVAVDEFEKRILFAEVKRNPEKIDLGILESKSARFFNSVPRYSACSCEYRAISLADM